MSEREPKSSTSLPAASTAGDSLAAFDAVSRSARLSDVVALAHGVIMGVAGRRSTDGTGLAAVEALATEASLGHDDLETPFGSIRRALACVGEGDAEAALARALAAHAVVEAARSSAEDEDRLAGDLLWLATHTQFDALDLLDRALGDEAAELWEAVFDRIKRIDRGTLRTLGRAEALVGAAALVASENARARELATRLASEVRDPALVALAGAREGESDEIVELSGELVATRRGRVVTTLLALSGLLALGHLARLFCRLALDLRRPATVELSADGVRVRSQTLLLGRVLRERDLLFKPQQLETLAREIRYPNLAYYAGLAALALGSYFGVRLAADGARAASPSLLAVGVVVVALGVGLELAVSRLLPASRGKARLIIKGHSGPAFHVGDLARERVDRALDRWVPPAGRASTS